MIPLLLTLLVMISLGTVAHADTAKNAEVKSGSEKATVSFTIENVLALEATASTAENVGFKVNDITPKIQKGKEGTDWIEMHKSSDKVVLVGENIPSSITLTVELESSSPMKNGSYPVTLKYGRTNANGAYSERSMVAIIYVGIAAPDGSSDGSSSTTTTKDPAKEETTEPQVEITDTEGSNRVDMMGMLDLSMLRSALEEAEKLKNSGRLNSGELEKLQAAIDEGEEALLSDRQAVVDDAAFKLWAVIEELGGPVTDEEKKPEKDRSGGSGILLPLILGIAAIFGIVGVLLYSRMKKKATVKYEGAPIVDYEIGDDDVL